jgi:hypothetical protein
MARDIQDNGSAQDCPRGVRGEGQIILSAGCMTLPIARLPVGIMVWSTGCMTLPSTESPAT